MADLAEVLQTEHLAIRHIKKAFEREVAIAEFQDFDRYLKDCHIEIEEKLLFPILKASDWEDSGEFNATADRIVKDHRLIGTLSDNLMRWYNEGDLHLFSERFQLYFRLLLDHNNSEEELIFPRWAFLPEESLEEAMIEARNIIESYGKTSYLELTGLSSKAYEYIFRKKS